MQCHGDPCAIVLHAEPWCVLQACSGAGRNEEAVKGMEQMCGVTAEAAGGSVVHATQAAGVSLEARLQVSNSPGIVSLVFMGCSGSAKLFSGDRRRQGFYRQGFCRQGCCRQGYCRQGVCVW